MADPSSTSSSSSSMASSSATYLDSQRSAPQQLESERFKGTKVAHRLRKDVVALEHAFTKHQLVPKLESRPDQDQLISRGILRSESQGGASSRIQATQRKLQHNMTTDKVGHLLEKRSELGSLQQQNIIKDVHIAPALQAQSRALQKNLARANLYHALKHRPTVAELQARGIYGERTVEDLVDQPDEMGLDGKVVEGVTSEVLESEGAEESGPGYGPQEQDPQEQQEEVDMGEPKQPQQEFKEFAGPRSGHYAKFPPRSDGQLPASQPIVSGPDLDPSSTGPTGPSSGGSLPHGGVGVSSGSGHGGSGTYQRRSKNFHLTRILLKFVASLAEAGEISLQQKGILKDLIVDQDASILAVAECFDAEHDLNELKDSLTHLAASRQ